MLTSFLKGLNVEIVVAPVDDIAVTVVTDSDFDKIQQTVRFILALWHGFASLSKKIDGKILPLMCPPFSLNYKL